MQFKSKYRFSLNQLTDHRLSQSKVSNLKVIFQGGAHEAGFEDLPRQFQLEAF